MNMHIDSLCIALRLVVPSRLSHLYTGRIMCANDLFLPLLSVVSLQCKLDVCTDVTLTFDLRMVRQA